jgi:hypothetical protein
MGRTSFKRKKRQEKWRDFTVLYKLCLLIDFILISGKKKEFNCARD